jgi:hypothetical protein
LQRLEVSRPSPEGCMSPNSSRLPDRPVSLLLCSIQSSLSSREGNAAFEHCEPLSWPSLAWRRPTQAGLRRTARRSMSSPQRKRWPGAACPKPGEPGPTGSTTGHSRDAEPPNHRRIAAANDLVQRQAAPRRPAYRSCTGTRRLRSAPAVQAGLRRAPRCRLGSVRACMAAGMAQAQRLGMGTASKRC